MVWSTIFLDISCNLGLGHMNPMERMQDKACVYAKYIGLVWYRDDSGAFKWKLLVVQRR